jgi:co-chaperonin GroES (HSP10)
MRPIGKYLVIRKIEKEIRTQGGFLLSADDKNKMRYGVGQIVKIGADVKSVSDDEFIYYDKFASHEMIIAGEVLTVILEKDVVVVLESPDDFSV